MTLTSSQIDFFNENGFVIIDNFFNNEELSNFESSLRYLIKGKLQIASKNNPNLLLDEYSNSIFDDGLIKLEENLIINILLIFMIRFHKYLNFYN